MFRKRFGTSELLAKIHEAILKLYELPSVEPPDEFTMPHYHRYERIYCPKCMGDHNYDNCTANIGRRSRSKYFSENQDN